MLSGVVQPASRAPQLITDRKVGKPKKDRAARRAPDVEQAGQGKASRNKQAIEQDKVETYDLDAVNGFSIKSWVPTGQYMDTYA